MRNQFNFKHMTTIKKYFAPVLVLSAALLLLSCGKDDNGNGGGNGGGEGGDPNPPCRPRENDRMGQQQPPFRQAVRRGAESGHAVRRRQHGPVRPQRLYYLVQDQRVRRREQPGGIRFPMHVQCRQPRYVDHERPNDGHVPVRRSRQVTSRSSRIFSNTTSSTTCTFSSPGS